MDELLERLGYLAVLLAAAADAVVPIVPGESTVVAAAVLASEGHFELPLVILAGALGAALGDSVAYWIGAAGQGGVKRRIVSSLGDARILAAEELLQRRGWLLIIFCRFVPGLRTLTGVSSGMLGYPYRKFLPFSLLAGAMWATYAGVLGYFVGEAVDNVWISLGIAIATATGISFALLLLERPRLAGLLKG
jgi:membrane protein DedA with SNARE-associated domain